MGKGKQGRKAHDKGLIEKAIQKPSNPLLKEEKQRMEDIRTELEDEYNVLKEEIIKKLETTLKESQVIDNIMTELITGQVYFYRMLLSREGNMPTRKKAEAAWNWLEKVRKEKGKLTPQEEEKVAKESLRYVDILVRNQMKHENRQETKKRLLAIQNHARKLIKLLGEADYFHSTYLLWDNHFRPYMIDTISNNLQLLDNSISNAIPKIPKSVPRIQVTATKEIAKRIKWMLERNNIKPTVYKSGLWCKMLMLVITTVIATPEFYGKEFDGIEDLAMNTIRKVYYEEKALNGLVEKYRGSPLIIVDSSITSTQHNKPLKK